MENLAPVDSPSDVPTLASTKIPVQPEPPSNPQPNQLWFDTDDDGVPAPSGIPVGVTFPFAGWLVPAGYLFCEGQAVSRTTYAALFDVIGVDYGIGNGSTTFNIPDLRGRTPIGAGQGVGLTARILTVKTGSETHQLTGPEMPVHRHLRGVIYSGASVSNPGTRLASGGTGVFFANNGSGYSADSGGTENQGGDVPHNNMQPSIALNFIIKV